MKKRPELQLETVHRSPLESKVARQLTEAGIEFGYETRTVKFTVPSFEAKYKPDFNCGPIIIEAKGRFGHLGSNGAEVRQRLILARDQNPDLDIRIVFQKADIPLYKGSKTTQGKWATDHGFKWSDKGTVPASWIKEMKRGRSSNQTQ